MDTLKNLVIIAVLAAVGYGVYVSLSHKSELAQNQSTAPAWSGGPNVQLPSEATTNCPLNGANAMAAVPAVPANIAGPSDKTAVAPQFAAPPVPGNIASATAPSVAPPMPGTTPPLNMQPLNTPAMPYPSSVPPAVAMSTPAAPGQAAAVSAAPPLNAALATAQNTAPVGITPPESAPGAGVQNLLPPPGVAAPAATTANVAAATPSPTTIAAANVTPNAAPDASAAAAPAATPDAAAVDPAFLAKFNAFLDEVRKAANAGQLARAHLALSTLYNDNALPPLPKQQAQELSDLLGQLAGSVIYSPQHLLEKPYVVQPGDTLGKVAQKYSIPLQLLGHVNGLLPPNRVDDGDKDRPLPVGTEMKVFRGPFNAVVDLSRHELVLLLPDPSGEQRYAGRFPIGVGSDEPKLEGIYTVRNKTPNPSYRAPNGVTVNSGDPQNPLGTAWIGLTDRIGIHGAANPQGIGRDDNRGSICVRNNDLRDLYGILSVGSRVTIVR